MIGPATDLQIQRQMLIANHWTENLLRDRGVKGLRGLKWFPTHRKNYSIKQLNHPELPGIKSPTKMYTWLQLHMYQRMALSHINGRRGPWSYEGSINAVV